jgi:ATP-binding cassette subfamily B (MDR/TAP) protein 1
MAFGLLGALVAGGAIPVIAIALGSITDTFNPNSSKEEVNDNMRDIAIWIIIVGIVVWVFGYIYFAFWQHLAENIAFNLRSRYMHKLLSQDVAFFEKQNVSQLPAMISENFSIIQ